MERRYRGSSDGLITSTSKSLLGRASPRAWLPNKITLSGCAVSTMRRTISRMMPSFSELMLRNLYRVYQTFVSGRSRLSGSPRAFLCAVPDSANRRRYKQPHVMLLSHKDNHGIV